MDYQGNSNKAKEPQPEKNLEKIIQGDIVRKKKSLGERAKILFIGADGKDVVRYMILDVGIPRVRDMLFDMGKDGLQRFFYGERGRRMPGDPRGPQVRYNGILQSAVRQVGPVRGMSGRLPDQPPVRRNERHEMNELILTLKSDADDILEKMQDVIEAYGVFSLADLNELIGQPTATIDHKWGWTNIATAKIHPVREGYRVDLPPLEEI